jgi:hypothetical protein
MPDSLFATQGFQRFRAGNHHRLVAIGILFGLAIFLRKMRGASMQNIFDLRKTSLANKKATGKFPRRLFVWDSAEQTTCTTASSCTKGSCRWLVPPSHRRW